MENFLPFFGFSALILNVGDWRHLNQADLVTPANHKGPVKISWWLCNLLKMKHTVSWEDFSCGLAPVCGFDVEKLLLPVDRLPSI